jgi:hypothetical protein
MKLTDVYNILAADEYLVAGSGPAFPEECWSPGKDSFVIVYDKNDITEHGMHTMKRVYRIMPGGDLEEVPIRLMIDQVKAALKSKVNVDDLLEQVLSTGGPTALIKTHEIISKYPEVIEKIEPRKGCLFLEIPNPNPGETSEQIYLRF